MRKLLCSALLTVLAGLLVGGMPVKANAQANNTSITSDQKKYVVDQKTHIIENFAIVPNVDFKELDGFLEKQKPAIDKAQTQGEFGAAVQKALGGFGFSHIYLMTPQMVETREKHKVVGIGIMVGPDPKGIAVVRVYPGSSAMDAGLEPGDIIEQVNGKKAEQTSIRGEEGSSVSLEVEHPDGKHQKYTMQRTSYSTAIPASLVMVDKDTAVLRVPTFDNSYDGSKIQSLMKEAADAKNLVIDLRGNPGGVVVNMIGFLGIMMPAESKIGTFINSRNVRKYQQDHPGPVDIKNVAEEAPPAAAVKVTKQGIPPYTGTIAVLINGGSGSAAEMAATALHDIRGATVVGTKSAGAVLVSVMRDLPGTGFKLQFPLADYVTSVGTRLEGHGVIPDFTVADPRFPGRDKDAPLDKAVAIIEKMDAQHASIAH